MTVTGYSENPVRLIIYELSYTLHYEIQVPKSRNQIQNKGCKWIIYKDKSMHLRISTLLFKIH